MRHSYDAKKLARHRRRPAELLLVPMIDIFTDRNTGPLATLPNKPEGYDYAGLTEYLKRVKAKFPEKTDATILLEKDTPYDILVQVMDHVRVLEVKEGITTVQAELFPDISIGDAPI
jgi:hypothetical protein